MKKTILAIAIATLSTVALAEGGNGGAGGMGGNGPQSNSESTSSAGASAYSGPSTSSAGASAYSGPSVSGAGAYAGGSQSGVTNVSPQSMTYNEAPIPAQTRANVVYSGSYELKNVPAITAPNLTTTLTETCMGSSSVGGAGAGFGFSFGTTWRDTACVRRLDARQVQSLGDAQAAKEVMCESESVKAAFARVGRPCAADASTTAAGSIVSQPIAQPVAKIDADVEQVPAVSPWHNNIH